MKLKTLAIALVTISLSTAAFAQMGNPGRGSGGTGNGTGSGMVPGRGMGNGNGPGGAGIPDIVVGTDGTAFLVRHLEADPVGQFEVVAIRSTGTIGWSYKLPALGPAELIVAGANVVAVGGYGQGSQGTPPATPVAPVSKLTAISQASGSAVWTLSIDGKLMDVKAFAAGFYLTVVKPPADATATHIPGDGLGEKSLVAVSNDGAILWTVKLN
ncbi:MAG: hypothetical protein NDJ92_07685 [Thermoanaerobaculia bacterium]|nr:hypothetical protein [Thermoanaerobaculia bacterium]